MLLEWLRAHTSDIWGWAATGGSGPTVMAVANANEVDNTIALLLGLIVMFVMAVFTGQLVPRWKHVSDLKYREDLLKRKDEIIDKTHEQFDKVLNERSATTKIVEDIRAELQRIVPRGVGGRRQ